MMQSAGGLKASEGFGPPNAQLIEGNNPTHKIDKLIPHEPRTQCVNNASILDLINHILQDACLTFISSIIHA